MFIWLAISGILLLILVFFWILQIRNSAITGEKSRNKHFHRLANQLEFDFITDQYFVQLEGRRNGMRIILYPHNFEGPGLVTILYLETTVSAKEKNWMEPNLSLGRALVEWKRGAIYGYEINGDHLAQATDLITELHAMGKKYPYVAITLPQRFSYSPLLQQSLKTWKNYAVLIAVDAGKRPSKEELEQAISDAVSLANRTAQSVTFSDTTG